MLKPRAEIESLADDDNDIYLKTKLETYLKKPAQLASLTYPSTGRNIQQLQLNRKNQLAKLNMDKYWF